MAVNQIIAWASSDGTIHASQTFAELHDQQCARNEFIFHIDNAIDLQEETVDYDYIAENILKLAKLTMSFNADPIIPLDDYYRCVNDAITRSNEI